MARAEAREDIRERLARIVGRDEAERSAAQYEAGDREAPGEEQRDIRERLNAALGRAKHAGPDEGQEKAERERENEREGISPRRGLGLGL